MSGRPTLPRTGLRTFPAGKPARSAGDAVTVLLSEVARAASPAMLLKARRCARLGRLTPAGTLLIGSDRLTRVCLSTQAHWGRHGSRVSVSW